MLKQATGERTLNSRIRGGLWKQTHSYAVGDESIPLILEASPLMPRPLPKYLPLSSHDELSLLAACGAPS